jgi:hypothetical protein
MRSSPQVAPVCVALMRTLPSCATYATCGLRRSASTAAGVRVAAKPFNAAV